MLLHEIRSDFRERIEDETYWDDDRCTALANAAQRDIIARLHIKIQGYAEFPTVDGTQRYTLPVDLIASHLLWYNTSHDQVIKIHDSPNDIYGVVSDVTTEGQPTDGFLWAVEDIEELWLYPVPDDAYTLQWWYWRRAPKLVHDDDEPLIPRHMHNYIVDFCELRAKVQDGEIGESEFMTLWNVKIKEMQVSNANKILLTTKPTIGTGKKMFPGGGAAGDGLMLTLTDQSGGGKIWGIG